MIILTLRIRPSAQNTQGALAVLEATRPGVEGCAGCLEYSFTVDVRTEGGIHLVERWEEEDDLHRHLRSDGFRRILELMELSVDAPDLHVFQVQEMAGLEMVEAARAASAG